MTPALAIRAFTAGAWRALLFVHRTALIWLGWRTVPSFQPEEEFARMLGVLEKDDFESEVCAFMRRCVVDFQNVPAQPQGDGGLDGLSHAQTTGYCCYGPEQEPSKVKARGLKSDILKKFRSDLRTVLASGIAQIRPTEIV